MTNISNSKRLLDSPKLTKNDILAATKIDLVYAVLKFSNCDEIEVFSYETIIEHCWAHKNKEDWKYHMPSPKKTSFVVIDNMKDFEIKENHYVLYKHFDFDYIINEDDIEQTMLTNYQINKKCEQYYFDHVQKILIVGYPKL